MQGDMDNIVMSLLSPASLNDPWEGAHQKWGVQVLLQASQQQHPPLLEQHRHLL